MFPELYPNIAWEEGIESLEQELIDIQKDIFDKDSAEKIISDKIIKVRLKNKESKILFIHVEVQSSSNKDNVFGERGKDKSYIYKLPELEEDIIRYNFRTIDVETINLETIGEDNPLRLVFKIAKELLNTKQTDKEIYEAKICLATDLQGYDKVKNMEQNRALVYLLEYLFLIEDPLMKSKYNEFKRSIGGAFEMTVNEIREKHLVLKGKDEKALEIAKNLLDILDDETIVAKTGLDIETVKELRQKI